MLVVCSEFKKAEEALQKAKQQAEQHTVSWKAREVELETLQLEVAELQGAVQAARAQLQESAQAAQLLQRDLQQAQEDHRQATVRPSLLTPHSSARRHSGVRQCGVRCAIHQGSRAVAGPLADVKLRFFFVHIMNVMI